jgi:hypothetical protein
MPAQGLGPQMLDREQSRQVEAKGCSTRVASSGTLAGAADLSPKCSSCAHAKGTPYGGLGKKSCMADERKRDVYDYVHINPATGLPLASYINEPRPDWCPRLSGAAD